jgi:hypothetical protein
MKFWTMALLMLAIGWGAPAQAAVSPGCRVLAESANRANLEARGGFVAQFEPRGEATTEQEKSQRLAEAADAVLLAGAVRTICSGADEAAPAAAIAKDVAAHQATIAAALTKGDCLAVLAPVQNRLLELARGLEAGGVDPMMPHVLGGTVALGEMVRDRCGGDARTAAAELIEQGASLRKLYDTVGTCQPLQTHYQQMLMRAASIVADAAQADYDKFLHDEYDPALAGLKSGCGDILNPEVLAANDAKVRDFAKLKEDALKARTATPPAPAAVPHR